MRRLLTLLLFLVCFSNEARSQSGGAHTPYASAASEAKAIIKASRGSLLRVTFANLTANAGIIVVLNAITTPSNAAALLPLWCGRIAASSNVDFDFSYSPLAFNTGIVVSATAAATCFTQTDASQPSGFYTVLFE